MRSRSMILVPVFACVACLALASGARASLITYAITGVVDSVDDGADIFGGAFSAGMPFTGSLRYDTSLPDVDPLSSTGRYEADPVGNLLGITMSLGGVDLTTNPALSWGSVVVLDEADNDLFLTVINDPESSAAWSADQLEVLLVSEHGDSVSSDSLPLDLDLADWGTTHTLSFLSIEQLNFGFVFGEIQSITKLPEPTTGLLLAWALVAATRREHGAR